MLLGVGSGKSHLAGQIRSRCRHRYCWFINTPALELGGKSPEGLECRGLNSLPLRGRKQVWGKSPRLLPSVLLLGSTRVALPGCQAPQATSNVHMEPLALHCLSFPSQGRAKLLPPWPWHWPGCIPPLHQTIHSYSSCSPKLGYFPWRLSVPCCLTVSFSKLRLCQLCISSSFLIH